MFYPIRSKERKIALSRKDILALTNGLQEIPIAQSSGNIDQSLLPSGGAHEE
jgi:hypothetical protein